MVRERQPRVCVIGPLLLEEERELAQRPGPPQWLGYTSSWFGIPCVHQGDDPPSRRIASSAGATASGTCSDGLSCPRSAAAMTFFCSDR
jgi:hypothetical protein